MGRLIFSTQMALDGLIDPMAAGGGWFVPTSENAARGRQQLRDAEAMLLGWTTFEGLAGFWSTQQDESAELLNPMTKYVVSRSPHEQVPWNGSMVEGGIDGVADLKSRARRRPVVGRLWQLAHELSLRGLVDEPAVPGCTRSSPGSAPPVHGRGQVRMELIDEQRLDHGVVLLCYGPAGYRRAADAPAARRGAGGCRSCTHRGRARSCRTGGRARAAAVMNDLAQRGRGFRPRARSPVETA